LHIVALLLNEHIEVFILRIRERVLYVPSKYLQVDDFFYEELAVMFWLSL
jgi:hypothetical protein